MKNGSFFFFVNSEFSAERMRYFQTSIYQQMEQKPEKRKANAKLDAETALILLLRMLLYWSLRKNML